VCGDAHITAKSPRLVLNGKRYDLCQRLFLGAAEHPVMTTIVDVSSCSPEGGYVKVSCM